MLIETSFSLNSKIMHEVINIYCLMCKENCLTTDCCPAEIAMKRGEDIQRIELIGDPNESRIITV